MPKTTLNADERPTADKLLRKLKSVAHSHSMDVTYEEALAEAGVGPGDHHDAVMRAVEFQFEAWITSERRRSE